MTVVEGPAHGGDEELTNIRALRAWAASFPGDIPDQWALPYETHDALREVCGVLGARGGAATFGPIAAALREILAGEDLAVVAESEHALDLAINQDDWVSVQTILDGRDLTGWSWGSGDPLPPRHVVEGDE